MTNGLLLYDQIFAHFLIYYEALPIYDFATVPFFIFFSFLSVHEMMLQQVAMTILSVQSLQLRTLLRKILNGCRHCSDLK
jgi:hypothetical protein